MSDYDDIIGKMVSKGPKAPLVPDEYDQVIGDKMNLQKSALKQSMFVAEKTQPDRAAKVAELSNRLNVPPAFVDKNFDVLSQKQDRVATDYDSIIKNTPAVAKFLENPQNASIARDDLDSLGKIEKSYARIKSKGSQPGFLSDLGTASMTGFNDLGASSGHLAAAYGLTDPRIAAEMTAERNRRSDELRAQRPDYANEFSKIMTEEGEDVDKAWNRFSGSYAQMRDGNILKALTDFSVGGAMTVGETLDMIRAAGARPKGLAYSSVESLAHSFPSLATGLAGMKVGGVIGSVAGPAGTVVGGIGGFLSGTFMGSSATEIGSQINESLRKRGIDITSADDLMRAYSDPQIMAQVRGEAERKGLTTAAVDTMFAMFAGKYLKGAAGKGIVSKGVAVAKDIGVQSVGEGTSEFAGQVAREKGDLSKVSVGESIQESLVSFGHSVGETVVGASARKVFSKNPTQAAVEIADATDKAIQAQEAAEALGELGQAVKESKTGQRLPEKIRELMDVATDGEASSVYFQADDWNSYWTKKGVSPVQAAEQILGDGGKAYMEAVETGQQLEIPIADYVEKVAMTDDFEGLLPVTRTAPDGMTLSEAKEHLANLPATMEELAREVTGQPDPKQVEAEAAAVEAKQVRDSVVEQLKAIGMDDKTAETNAEIYEASFRTLAERSGLKPLELFQKYGLKIAQPEMRGELAAGEQSFDQGNLPAVQQQVQPSPLGFVSQVETEVSKMDFKQIPAADLANRITKIEGLKKEELEWIGLIDWLKMRAEGRSTYTIQFKDETLPRKETFESREAAEKYINDGDYVREGWTISEVPSSNKVTKEEVVEFIKQNGVQVEQVVLAEDFKGEGTSLGDITFTEEKRIDLDDHYLTQQNIDSEAENYLSDVEGYFGEAIAEWRQELTEKHTDDEGEVDNAAIERDLEEKISDAAYAQAKESVESDDYYGARYRVEVEDNDEIYLERPYEDAKWHDHDGNEYEYDLEESKILYLGSLLDQGLIEGEKSELIRAEDLDWGKPEADKKPGAAAITKRMNKLLKTDRARLEAKAREEMPWSFRHNDTDSEQDRKESEEGAIKDIAKEEAEAYYTDPSNPKNTVRVNIKHPMVTGWISGNDKNGYELLYESLRVSNNRYTLESKTIEEAKVEAKAKMIEVGDLKDASSPADPETDDINRPTGKSNWQRYTADGPKENYREILLTLPKTKEEFTYDTHFRGHENFVAHVRLTDRKDAQGRKVLFIEELQSDWHQQGRERGYKGTSSLTEAENARRLELDKSFSSHTPEERAEYSALYDKHVAANSGVPDAPFKNTESWTALAMKRMIRLAVEQGYDAVAWTPADVHVERWGTDEVSWVKRDAGFKVKHKDPEVQALADKRERGGVNSEFFKTREELNEFLSHGSRKEGLEVIEVPAHWLVGSAEQRGGNADGVNIEELARQRGELLETRGKKVTTKEELRTVVANTLGRERKDRSLDSITDRIWKQMQEGDSPTGQIQPRKEGMEFFYNKMMPDVTKKILKKLDKDAKIEVNEIDLGNADEVLVYDGPELSGEQLRSLSESTKNNSASAEYLRRLSEYVDSGASVQQAIDRAAIKNSNTLDYVIDLLGGKLKREKISDKTLSFSITDEIKKKSAEGMALFQGGQDNPRGQIRFGADRQFNIDILKNADPSTFLHETGHFFLEVLGDLAETEGASPQVKDDFRVILDWFGVQSRAEIKVEHHEMWARGFEAYLMEGKAPTSKLRKAFTRFKVWLTSVYRELKNLNVQLSPEVRGVMDRLLATEEEIRDAQAEVGQDPLFTSEPETFGMTGEKAVRYIEAVEDARHAAEETITRKVMAQFAREHEDWYKEQRAKIRTQVEEEVNKQNVYKALAHLQKGKQADGSPLPQGVQPIKLNREELVRSYGAEFVKNKLPRPYVYSREGGVHHDVAAEALGFESGDVMITQMVNAPPKNELIDAITDRRLEEKYPNMLRDGTLPQEAIDAVHNDKRAQIMRMELEHLASENMPVLKDVIRKVTRRVPSDKAVKAQATKIIGSMSVKDVRPDKFKRAETKAAREAGEALTRGDLEGAFLAKQRELLNHELYRSATAARETVEKSLENFKKISRPDEKLAKTRDMNLVSTARAILASFGLAKTDAPPMSFIEKIKQYDPDSFETVQALLESATLRTGDYKSISFDDFIAMKDAVDALWDLSKTSRQIEIDGIKMDREEVKGDILARLAELAKPGKKKPGLQKAVDDSEKFTMDLQSAKAGLRRVESWVDAMDGGDAKGVFRKYIWQPISEAVTRYRVARNEHLKKFKDIITPIEKTLIKEDIKAPELGYTFSGRAELLGAMLHTGNESNLTKLLVGRAWGTKDPEGNIDASKWNAFVKRMQDEGFLTKTDYDVLQNLWDLFESTKPQAQQVHRDMYGFYFNEVTANEIETPFGKYRGGYAPAMADQLIVEDAAIRGEKESLEKSNNSFMFPTAGRGFTKSRVENYTVPLVMDLKLVPMQLDKVLRFIHIEPRVKEVGRLMWDRGMRSAMNEVDDKAVAKMIIPWLQRAAQQMTETRVDGWEGHRFWRALRTRTGLNVMAGNVTNTLQQFTGFTIAAVKVKPRHLRNALWRYVRAPKTVSAQVAEKSDFMDTRMTTQVMEIHQAIDDILLNPTKYEKAKDFAKKHGYFLQSSAQNIIDSIVWSGAYDQAIEGGADEKQAVREADSAVRQTQGSFNPEDISRFEAGSAFARVMTMFYSYFNMQANLLGTEFGNVARELGLKKGAGKMLYIYTMGFMLPAVLSDLIVKTMAGGIDEDDDDQYLDDVVASFFGAQFRSGTALFPFVGPAVNSGVNSFNDKWYDDRISTSPAVSMVESAVKAPFSVYKAITDDGKSRKAIKDVMSALGMLTGAPLAPISRPLGYSADVLEGNIDPNGPVDFTRGLVTGKARQ